MQPALCEILSFLFPANVYTIDIYLSAYVQETPASGETSSLEGKPIGEGEEQGRKVDAQEAGEAKEQENGYNTDHLNGQGKSFTSARCRYFNR